MGKFKNEGDAALALAEECAEVIQVINKKYRFNGEWYEIAPGKDRTRWTELQAEMEDLFHQWSRLKEQVMGKPVILSDWECCEGTLHSWNEECDCPSAADYWDGDETDKNPN